MTIRAASRTDLEEGRMAAEPDIDALVAAAVERHLARRLDPPNKQRVNVFDQTFSGPSRNRSAAVDALKAEGFDARAADCLYGDDKDEAKKGWVVAETVLTAVPDGEHQAALLQRAAAAVRTVGYELRGHAVTWGWRDKEATP